MTSTTFDEGPPDRDPVCGCRVVQFTANRRDRREAARRGMPPVPTVTRHRHGCQRGPKSISDAGRAGRTDPPGDVA